MTGDEDPVEDAREEVIDALGRAATVYGVNRSYGRLYGVLFFAREPLSLDELAVEGGYAKSTVSDAMSALERYHLVRRVSKPGSGRRVHFEAETDFGYVFQRFLDEEVRREIEIMRRALAAAEERLEDADDERAATDLERVRRLRSLYERSARFVDLATSQPVDRLLELANRALGSEDGPGRGRDLR